MKPPRRRHDSEPVEGKISDRRELNRLVGYTNCDGWPAHLADPCPPARVKALMASPEGLKWRKEGGAENVWVSADARVRIERRDERLRYLLHQDMLAGDALLGARWILYGAPGR